MERVKLYSLVDPKSPVAVLEETKWLFLCWYPFSFFLPIREIFRDFLRLFQGQFPGYQACNTPYHDIRHTTDTFLTLARIIDGYNLENSVLPKEYMQTALAAALFHDSGYIQEVGDDQGTGAKYTFAHEERSKDFIREYFPRFPELKVESACRMVDCTKPAIDPKQVPFPHQEEKILGFMLGTADLLGAIASRIYLEKLLLLYYEFEEANANLYQSELDLLRQTRNFYEKTEHRFKEQFGGVYVCADRSLQKRYNLEAALYQRSVKNGYHYLRDFLQKEPEDYLEKLRREGIVQKLLEKIGR